MQTFQKKTIAKTGSPLLWDLFCAGTLVGIWPRFIEPKMILTTKLDVEIPDLPLSLEGFKILQLSDLHITDKDETAFDDRLFKKIKALHPDLIALTGDFLCYSHIYNRNRLRSFLNRLDAPYGCFAVLGNHDYASCVTLNENGDYDVLRKRQKSTLTRAFGRMLKNTALSKQTTPEAKSIPLHSDLVSILKESPVKLLHNSTCTFPVNDTKLNVCGVGEYTLGKIDPTAAFADYDKQFPGIILMHNPDGIKLLKDQPGHIVLSGHTHGGQVNLPWMWKKFILIEDNNLKKGLKRVNGKWLYVNRGLGSVLPFRWFAPPEILLLTLKGKR